MAVTISGEGNLGGTNIVVGGNLDVTGNLNYENVTDVDSIGILTARSGIRIGGGTTVGPISGIVTYFGDGSQLTGIDASKIETGNTKVETVDTGSDGHVKITTEGSERLRITSAGNVGIGTDNPGRPLHIFDDTNDTNVKIEATAAGKDARLELIANSTGVSQIRLGDEATANIGLITYEHSNDSLELKATDNVIIQAGGATERMRIGSTGLISITKSSTDAAAPDKTTSTIPNGPAIDLVNTSGSNDSGGSINAIGLGAEGRYASIVFEDKTSDNTGTGGDIAFFTSGSKTGALNERLRISKDGAFGIAGANYGSSGQVIKSNGSAAPTWQSLYSFMFYGRQDSAHTIADATYTRIKNLGTNAINQGDSSIATWNESVGTLTIGASGAGYWFLAGGSGIDDVSSGDYMQTVIGLNGTTTSVNAAISTYARSMSSASNFILESNVTTMVYLEDGDVVSCYIYQAGTSASQPTEPNRCFFMGYRIGP